MFLSEGVSTLAVVQVSERGKASYDANGKQQLLFTTPPPTARGHNPHARRAGSFHRCHRLGL